MLLDLFETRQCAEEPQGEGEEIITDAQRILDHEICRINWMQDGSIEVMILQGGMIIAVSRKM